LGGRVGLCICKFASNNLSLEDISPLVMLLVDVSLVNSFVAVTHVSKAIAPVTNTLLLFVVSVSVSVHFNSSRTTFTPKMTSGKTLSRCRERVFKQNVFPFTLEDVKVCYFLIVASPAKGHWGTCPPRLPNRRANYPRTV